MSTIKAFITNYAVATYFALTFLISWGGVLAVAGPKIPTTKAEFEKLLPMIVVMMLAGPISVIPNAAPSVAPLGPAVGRSVSLKKMPCLYVVHVVEFRHRQHVVCEGCPQDAPPDKPAPWRARRKRPRAPCY